MKKLHFAVLVCALSTPAMAQMSEPTPPAPPSAPAADAPPPAAAPAASLADTISADFPKYDTDKSGELSKAEFSTWISEARSASGGTTPDKEALSEAFVKADADKNKTVSAAELTSFLS